MNGLETSLTPDMLTASLNGMYSTDVDVYLPKFKFDASFQLGDTLKSMGIIDTFNPIQADLSGIVSPDVEQLYISSVIHKATIEVDEAGTVAAAATGVVATAYNACFGCGAPPPQVFDADHPFLFALRDVHSGSLLFMGRVMQPGSASISSLTGPVIPEPRSSFLLAVGIGIISIGRLQLPFRRRCGLAL
jgi:serpin B